MPSRERGRRKSTERAARAEAKLVWIMPSREGGRRQSTERAVGQRISFWDTIPQAQ